MMVLNNKSVFNKSFLCACLLLSISFISADDENVVQKKIVRRSSDLSAGSVGIENIKQDKSILTLNDKSISNLADPMSLINNNLPNRSIRRKTEEKENIPLIQRRGIQRKTEDKEEEKVETPLVVRRAVQRKVDEEDNSKVEAPEIVRRAIQRKVDEEDNSKVEAPEIVRRAIQRKVEEEDNSRTEAPEVVRRAIQRKVEEEDSRTEAPEVVRRAIQRKVEEEDSRTEAPEVVRRAIQRKVEDKEDDRAEAPEVVRRAIQRKVEEEDNRTTEAPEVVRRAIQRKVEEEDNRTEAPEVVRRAIQRKTGNAESFASQVDDFDETLNSENYDDSVLTNESQAEVLSQEEVASEAETINRPKRSLRRVNQSPNATTSGNQEVVKKQVKVPQSVLYPTSDVAPQPVKKASPSKATKRGGIRRSRNMPGSSDRKVIKDITKEGANGEFIREVTEEVIPRKVLKTTTKNTPDGSKIEESIIEMFSPIHYITRTITDSDGQKRVENSRQTLNGVGSSKKIIRVVITDRNGNVTVNEKDYDDDKESSDSVSDVEQQASVISTKDASYMVYGDINKSSSYEYEDEVSVPLKSETGETRRTIKRKTRVENITTGGSDDDILGSSSQRAKKPRQLIRKTTVDTSDLINNGEVPSSHRQVIRKTTWEAATAEAVNLDESGQIVGGASKPSYGSSATQAEEDGERNHRYITSASSGNTNVKSNDIVYYYVEGDIYNIFMNPKEVTDITLEVGETVETIEFENSREWMAEAVDVYEKGVVTTHLYLTPFLDNIRTMCKVKTDKREYNLMLYSTTNLTMQTLHWKYRYSRYDKVRSTTERKGHVVDISAVDYNYVWYSVDSSREENLYDVIWKPVCVYSDGEFTYIQLPIKFAGVREYPKLFMKSLEYGLETINYVRKGVNLIIPFEITNREQLIMSFDKEDYIIQKGGR